MTKEECEIETSKVIMEMRKHIAELKEENEKRLSVLLSCKNCPDNKGGFICQKEYEDKCLTQKIQYIKELKEENAELEKENAELKEKFTKAKEIIKDYMIIVEGDHTEVCSVPEENRCINVLKLNEQAEQFLKEVSE